ncbi:MAG: hypothetical protein ACK559_01420, partial [bacterium]
MRAAAAALQERAVAASPGGEHGVAARHGAQPAQAPGGLQARGVEAVAPGVEVAAAAARVAARSALARGRGHVEVDRAERGVDGGHEGGRGPRRG